MHDNSLTFEQEIRDLLLMKSGSIFCSQEPALHWSTSVPAMRHIQHSLVMKSVCAHILAIHFTGQHLSALYHSVDHSGYLFSKGVVYLGGTLVNIVPGQYFIPQEKTELLVHIELK